MNIRNLYRPWLLAAAIATIAGACTPHYLDVVAPFGARKALELQFVDDGGTFDLYLKNAANDQPVAGLRILIGDGEGRVELVSDERGHIAFPVSSQLLADNPPVDIIKPEGVGTVKMTFTMSHRCVPGEGVVTKFRNLTAEQIEGWPALGEDDDRVYVEPGVEEGAGEFMMSLLARQRAALTEITSLPPPPIAIALVAKNEHVMVSGEDRDGRRIWPVRPDEKDKYRTTIGTVSHEWMHDILRKNYGFEGDVKTRYIEDGLCELVAHLVYTSIRGPAGSPIVEGRIQELSQKKKSLSTTIDILHLSEEFDVSAYDNIVEALVAVCEHQDLNVVVGYSLGLAFWLDRVGSQPDFHKLFLVELSNTKKSGIDTIMGIIDKVTKRPGLHPRSIIVDDALLTLKRHQ